jgi:hypothetical protein
MDGGGGGNSNSSRFYTFSWKKENEISSYLWDIALIYTSLTRTLQKVVSCWRVPLLNGHHLHTHSQNHLSNLSIGAARGAENDPDVATI